MHIYLLCVISFESDGYRSEDIEFHKKIDKEILSILKKWKINYICLDKMDIKVRVNNVIKEMKNFNAFKTPEIYKQY